LNPTVADLADFRRRSRARHFTAEASVGELAAMDLELNQPGVLKVIDRAFAEGFRTFSARRARELMLRLEDRCKRYSIDVDYFFQMWEQQDYGCAICHKPLSLSQTCIDHDHERQSSEYSSVRGLLCNRCNLDLRNVEEWWRSRAEFEGWLHGRSEVEASPEQRGQFQDFICARTTTSCLGTTTNNDRMSDESGTMEP
jgi:hypothetical protein